MQEQFDQQMTDTTEENEKRFREVKEESKAEIEKLEKAKTEIIESISSKVTRLYSHVPIWINSLLIEPRA